MSLGKIRISARAIAAIAAAVMAASTGGWNAYVASNSAKQLTPEQVIHKAVEAGLTPPAVDLAIKGLIKPWEGLVLKAHWDRFSKRYDICHGDTLINGKPVTADMSFTSEQCLAILKIRVTRDYFLPLVDKVKDYAIAPMSLQASMLSGAYNVGTGAIVKSGAAKALSKHDFYDACIKQTAFNKAGGEVLVGLEHRRGMGDASRMGEAEVCVSGLGKKYQ